MLLYESGEGREARLEVGVVLEGSECGVGPVLTLSKLQVYIALQIVNLTFEFGILGLERCNLLLDSLEVGLDGGLERCQLIEQLLLGNSVLCLELTL